MKKRFFICLTGLIITSALFFSCKDYAESFNEYSYVYDLTGTFSEVITAQTEGVAAKTESRMLTNSYAEISWRQYTGSNYQDYGITLYYYTTNNTSSMQTLSFVVREEDGSYSVLRSTQEEKIVFVDNASPEDSEFSINYTIGNLQSVGSIVSSTLSFSRR